MKNDGGLKLTVDKKISPVVENDSNMSIALSSLISTLIIEKSPSRVLEHYQERFEMLINEEIMLVLTKRKTFEKQLSQMELDRTVKDINKYNFIPEYKAVNYMDDETHIFKAKDDDEAKHWIINHLDCSKTWSFEKVLFHELQDKE